MDEDAAHSDAAQQKHVLGQRPVERLVDRRPAQLHHHRAAVEALDVGQAWTRIGAVSVASDWAGAGSRLRWDDGSSS